MRNRRKRGASARVDVNVTSLVDVAFTLLCVFIIIAPVMQGGIDIGVPETDVAPVAASADRLLLSVTSAGHVYVDQDTTRTPDVRAMLQARSSGGAATPVHVRADRAASYEAVMDVLGAVRAAGFGEIHLIADPRRK
jgi:biopolymer transport protein TolR